MRNHPHYKKFAAIVSNYTPNQIRNASYQAMANVLEIDISSHTDAFFENLRDHLLGLRLHQIRQEEFQFYKQSLINGDIQAIKDKWPDYSLKDVYIDGHRSFVFYTDGNGE
jgi:hypothetical protein